MNSPPTSTRSSVRMRCTRRLLSLASLRGTVTIARMTPEELPSRWCPPTRRRGRTSRRSSARGARGSGAGAGATSSRRASPSAASPPGSAPTDCAAGRSAAIPSRRRPAAWPPTSTRESVGWCALEPRPAYARMPNARAPSPTKTVQRRALSLLVLRHALHVPGARRLHRRRVAPALGAAGRDLVDDHDVEREDRERPERIPRDREQRGDRAEARGADADVAAVQAPGPQRAGGKHLEDADDQRDPPPGLEVAEDVLRVRDEELRIADRGNAVDHVQRARYHEQDARERHPAGPLLVHGLLQSIVGRRLRPGGPDEPGNRSPSRAMGRSRPLGV